eukprot:5013121-Pleurochrysis_carterae.AAC.1
MAWADIVRALLRRVRSHVPDRSVGAGPAAVPPSQDHPREQSSPAAWGKHTRRTGAGRPAQRAPERVRRP